MFGRLLLLFIGIPVLELCIFLMLGSRIGISTTLAIIVITAVIGAYLTKSQGLKALRKYQTALAEGRLPHEEVLDGVMILIAGAVLLTPGFLTDAVGFCLLVPACREIIKSMTKASLKDRVTVVGRDIGAPGVDEVSPGRRARGSGPDVINVEAEVVDTPEPARRPSDPS